MYDYLDTASIDGWISAFLSRNDSFQRDYDRVMSLRQLVSEQTKNKFVAPESVPSNPILDTLEAIELLVKGQAIDKRNHEVVDKISEMFRGLTQKLEDNEPQEAQDATDAAIAQNEMYNKYGVILTNVGSYMDNGIRIINVISPNRIKAYRIFSKDRIESELKNFFQKSWETLKNEKYDTIYMQDHNCDDDWVIRDVSPLLIFKYLFPEFYYDMHGEQILSSISDKKIGNSEPIRNFKPDRDSLLLRIDLRLTKREIMRQLEQHLDIHLIGKITRSRVDKWKYCLMAYDLRKTGLPYPEISEILRHSIVNEGEILSGEEAIENYGKTASKLIDEIVVGDKDSFSEKTIENYAKTAKRLIDDMEYKVLL
ncbi:hypothetical protein [Candidatus Magnetominusculus xianensis]|uniref:Uncharacterized protein n=1 Tax=Candidatus Magnetominusculus xianensis TaxID=1748249 RepID=A0ABR5SI81_9BACT|nr:hypothetical protein [Candidatus Magnetominusculus xianensis]KWT92035.1 hypothetical protein ASN18_0588 [Candidatus Magnetominusculus xianensis]MBF0404615.1 hypothetical protein [Nitrospirota bacterium]